MSSDNRNIASSTTGIKRKSDIAREKCSRIGTTQHVTPTNEILLTNRFSVLDKENVNERDISHISNSVKKGQNMASWRQ